MKRILSLLLAVMMVVTMLPITALADELELFATDEQVADSVDPVAPVADTDTDTRTVTYDGGSVEAVKVGTCGGMNVYLAELPYGATNFSSGMFDTATYPTTAWLGEDNWIKDAQFSEYITSCGITLDEGVTVSTTNVKGYIAQVYFSDGTKYVIYQVPTVESSGSEEPVADTRTVTYDGGSVEAVKVGTCGGKKVYLATLPEGATNISAGITDIATYPTGAWVSEDNWIKNEQFSEYITSCGITIDDGVTIPTTYVKGYIAQVYFSEDGNQWIIYQLPCEEESKPEPALSNLGITNVWSSSFDASKNFTLYPEFDPDTKEYKFVASDSLAGTSIYMWAFLNTEEYPSATATATYINSRDAETTVSLSNGNRSTLSRLIASGAVGQKDITITVHTNPGNEDDRVEIYTVTIYMAPAVWSVKLSWGDSSKNIYLSAMQYDGYEAFVPSNVGITVEATANNANSKIEIIDAVDGVVTPVWKNNCYTLQINVSCEGDSYASRYAIELYEAPTLVVEKAPDKTEYETGEKIDITGMAVKAVYSDHEEPIDLSSKDVTITPTATDILNDSIDKITVTYKEATAEYPITVKSYEFKGKGTEEDPYLLENADDCVGLSKEVAAGKTFAKTYFKITDNITLPEGWVPIGTENGFSGIIDGNNKLLTVPKDGLSLIGMPKGCTIKNLSIYGEKIPGYGLIEGYTTSCSATVDNVTIKSGSHILKSGIVGGYGNTSVNISNCTVEKGVVIGDDGTWGDLGTAEYNYNFVEKVINQDMIGSFCGAWNGTITNCVSYATVYGRNYVGGIVGFKGQSMRTFVIDNCAFYGDIIATGSYVGGIVGSGYSASSAPNTPCVIIQNCLVSGSVTGADKVGGIFGGNKRLQSCWNNGIGYIRANLVTGSVTATAENATVGAIIGHINAVNIYNIIKDNYYKEGVSAKGIGEITTVNTDNVYCETEAVSAADLTNGKAVELLNSAKAGVNPWKQGENSPVLSGNNRIYTISLSKLNSMRPQTFSSSKGYNNFITSGGDLTASYNDGSSVTVAVVDGITNGPDFTKSGVQLCSVTYDGYEHFFGINVSLDGDPADQQMKAVKIKVLGDTVHEVTADNVHTLANGNLVEWLGETTVMVPTDATALDVLEKAAKAYGISCVVNDSAYGKYIASITKNGVTLNDSCNKQSDGKAYCGWQFNVNGNAIYTSIDKTEVNEGDTLTVYFEDDYSLAYVQTAIDAIKAIPEATASDYDEKVDAAEASLKYLSPIALAKVEADSSFAKLVEARNRKAAKPVEDLIAAIGTVEYTEACKAKIDAARKAYDSLGKDVQKYVSNYQTLVAAEKAYADKVAAAANVEKLIAAIGTVEYTDACKEKIDAARKAYDSLDKDVQNRVPNYQTLVDAEKAYADKVAAAENAEKLIDAIGTVEYTDACKEKIDAARKAYDSLDKDVQKRVPNYQTLLDAEKEFADREAAAKAEELIDAIGTVTKDSGDAIKAAREAYDELNEEQKKYVSDEAVAALEKAEKLFDMISNSNKPDASDKSDGTGSIIHISSNAAAKGEENPNTGAEVFGIAPAMLMLGAVMLVLKKNR